MIFDKCDQNKWQNSIVSFAEIHVYIYYILESNLSSDQQWPEAVLIVLKFYFSAKTMGDVKRKCWKYTMYFYYSLMIRNRKTFHSKGCCKDMVCILRLLKCSWLWGKFQLWVKWYMYTCKCRHVKYMYLYNNMLLISKVIGMKIVNLVLRRK